MRGLLRSAAIVIALLVLFSMTVAEEKPWFDMEKCELCKPYMDVPGFFRMISGCWLVAARYDPNNQHEK